MELISLSHSALSLLPPVVAVLLAIITRRVLLSLGLGVLLGSFLVADSNLLLAFEYLFKTVLSLFWQEGEINKWNVDIIVFLILLGMMTSLMTISGATKAFASWATTRIKNPRGAKILTVLLGIFIFIDDYFNSLAVGSIARPVTDQYKISRAKLAYLLDSTAAPMCVIMPISSWGAYIIAIIGGILVTHNLTDLSPLMVFIEMAPMNFYAVFALLLVLLTAWFKLDIGVMKSHEEAAQNGQLFNPKSGVPAGQIIPPAQVNQAQVKDLLIPILSLIIATVFSIIYLGAQATEGPFNLILAFANTDATGALVYGGLIGLLVTIAMVLRGRIQSKDFFVSLWHGARSMFPAIVILLFAWSMASVISQLETGKYLSSLVDGSIHTAFLPAILFVLAGFMAFATGTSWGTFGIMLPIAADLAMGTNATLLLPMMASVLAGAVFGDHCSPISDTTILSSTGASCHHIDHVVTQLPYALVVAGVTLIGYMVLGFSGSVLAGLCAALLCFAIVVGLYVYKEKVSSPKEVMAASS
ncbi:Na+/H+ antiporter NhaC family protein [Motilimonas sp. 1_MG-2023]|uniref:Na+/H+ antiporter NhaC family protein n=1 Tax=Motilimonas sp. 1_MG-2023 TaxID=3062672 RepID=UPI0026E2AFAA|nr:Na+/H+ antiporter NhaC family protein [Motilimonas sp. 1_MG-2023]MDO6524668.1 Na+/H+ antiporter NhaC family protein [Motilimonas sp. 1_MG-2023]